MRSVENWVQQSALNKVYFISSIQSFVCLKGRIYREHRDRDGERERKTERVCSWFTSQKSVKEELSQVKTGSLELYLHLPSRWQMPNLLDHFPLLFSCPWQGAIIELGARIWSSARMEGPWHRCCIYRMLALVMSLHWNTRKTLENEKGINVNSNEKISRNTL